MGRKIETSTLPQMSSQEVAELVRHLVRCPELFLAARDQIESRHFKDGEQSYQAAWGMAKWIVGRHGVSILSDSSFPLRLANEIKKNLSSYDEEAYVDLFGEIFNPWGGQSSESVEDGGVDEAEEHWDDYEEDEFEEDENEEDENDVDGGDDEEDDDEEDEFEEDENEEDENDVDGGDDDSSNHEGNPAECETVEQEYADPWSATCWFELAFDTDPASVSVEYGRELLVRFLTERTITDDINETLEDLKQLHDVPCDWTEIAEELQRRQSLIATIQSPAFTTVAEQWADHERALDAYRGRDLVGLRTGLQQLDQRTLGLRGIGALGSPPGVGKTALCIDIALGVCRHHAENDAVVVFVALDMPKRDILSRIKCNLADIDARRLFLGSPNAPGGSFFSADDSRRLQSGERRLREEDIGNRLLVLDRSDLGENISADRLVQILSELKRRNGARRALLILDYLQILPVPEYAGGNDLDLDKDRVRVMQDVAAKTTTECNPLGDAVLFISEARKPPNSKEIWGGSLAEFMGTARLTYALDYALLYQRMTEREIPTYYGINGAAAIERHLLGLGEQGIAPAMLSLVKARDGMSKGKWGMEFLFRRTIHRELEPRDPEAAEYEGLADPGGRDEGQSEFAALMEDNEEDIGVRNPGS